MPCFDHTNRISDDHNRRAIEILEGMLCHAFTVAEQQILNAPLEIYLECGTKRVELQAWWDGHKAADKRRRALEEEKKRLIEEAQEMEAQQQRDKEERQRILDEMPPDVRRLFKP
jgi:hypothetical protein